MPTLNLKNITIEERTTINGETYFVTKDNNQNQVYFCFQNKLKENWDSLLSNWQETKEVEIKFEEHEKGNKVISLYAPNESEVLI